MGCKNDLKWATNGGIITDSVYIYLVKLSPFGFINVLESIKMKTLSLNIYIL